MRGADSGWVAIFAFVAAYDLVAAVRRREMLCGSARRHYANHPILLLLAVALLAHIFGHLPRYADPLHGAGVLAELLGESLRQWNRIRP